MGFGGSRHIDDSRITALWNTPNLPLVTYRDTTPPTALYAQDTLFNIGTKFILAGREVAFAARNTTALPAFANNINYAFLQANGPSTLYENYLHSLNFMVRRRCRLIQLFPYPCSKRAVAHGITQRLSRDACNGRSCLVQRW